MDAQEKQLESSSSPALSATQSLCGALRPYCAAGNDRSDSARSRGGAPLHRPRDRLGPRPRFERSRADREDAACDGFLVVDNASSADRARFLMLRTVRHSCGIARRSPKVESMRRPAIAASGACSVCGGGPPTYAFPLTRGSVAECRDCGVFIAQDESVSSEQDRRFTRASTNRVTSNTSSRSERANIVVCWHV